jgi:hypothetical protein
LELNNPRRKVNLEHVIDAVQGKRWSGRSVLLSGNKDGRLAVSDRDAPQQSGDGSRTAPICSAGDGA